VTIRLAALETMLESAIDTREMPEATDRSQAERGRFYRPVKRQITLRLDADVVDFFERGGKGYQTRMNEALREWVEHHRSRDGTSLYARSVRPTQLRLVIN
jgi:uncharacterized protein (DUF4415 family)